MVDNECPMVLSGVVSPAPDNAIPLHLWSWSSRKRIGAAVDCPMRRITETGSPLSEGLVMPIETVGRTRGEQTQHNAQTGGALFGDPPRGGLGAIIATAVDEVLAISATGPPALCATGPRNRVAVPGVRVRTIIAATAMDTGWRHRWFTADIRVTSAIPAEVLIVDRRLAIIHVPEWSTGPVLHRHPAVVKTTVDLFERVWRSATPIDHFNGTDSAELTPREQFLLSLLADGVTDDAAAKRLGVSVRTIRRIIAELKDRFGANNRFQLGIEATNRGWLSPKKLNRPGCDGVRSGSVTAG
ncbi:MAG: helix-turn-helix transcriptional regulator [Actinomycetota bacterium]|nr:helix-turn-helix transcriptional regulator [Actinomycetota bacterium]